jgi:hypothetical protein
LFWRKRRQNKVLDVVSAAILGGVAAGNDQTHLPAMQLQVNLAERTAVE